LQSLQAAWDRAEEIHRLWLPDQTSRERLQYSAYARLQARLASMPVIEQAKGIIMAQCGWPADQAFDALRRASQRSNIRVRDLAAKIVADTAKAGAPRAQAGPRQASPRRAAAPARPAHHTDFGGFTSPVAGRRRGGF
jgi:hypothetical protein